MLWTIGDTVGGLTITGGGLEITADGYKTAVYAVANSTSLAFQAGPENLPSFAVNGKGQVYIRNGSINITSDNAYEDAINVNSVFTVKRDGSVTANNITINGNNTNTKIIDTTYFSVDNNGNVVAGDINFNGNISAVLDNKTYTGMDDENICTVTNKDGTHTTWRVVKGLIVGRTY